MTYARVIVNPAAGAGKAARVWPQIRDCLRDISLKFEYDLTEGPGHAVELAEAATGNGYGMVVSVGGDGTVNEIANGLYNSGNIGNIKLGIIAVGTGADYVRSVGISRRHEDACRRLLESESLALDLGVMEYSINGKTAKRVFVNFAGLGFDAEIVRVTTQKFKALSGRPSYLAGLLTTLISYRNKEISIRVNGEAETKKVCTVIVSNGRYGGGGMLIAPQADPADGFLDVVIVEDLSKPDLLRSLPRIYKGTHLTHPKVSVLKVREVEIDTAESILLQADGELLGKAPVRFQVLPAMLNLAV